MPEAEPSSIGSHRFFDAGLTLPQLVCRVFIARSLPNFLPDVTPHEAVEYVLPLLNSLGTDPGKTSRPRLWLAESKRGR